MELPRRLRKRKRSEDAPSRTNHNTSSEANATSDDASDAFGLTLMSDQTTTTTSQYPVDVIAIHGLGGDTHKTWTHDNGRLWLRDFLPHDLQGARIFAYGYNSTVLFSKETSTLRDFARDLLGEIRCVRVTQVECSRPLIFVCHSMGGIVVKQALVIARNEASLYPGLNDSVSGIIFLATPHRGSSTASYGTILSRVVNVPVIGSQMSRFTGSVRTDLLARLQKSSEELFRLTEDFRVHVDTIHIGSFIEQKKTQGLDQRIVDDQSAVIGVPNERLMPMPNQDHQSICKFSKRDNNYRKLLREIMDCKQKSQQNQEGTQDSEEFHIQFQLDKIPTTKHFVIRKTETEAVKETLLPSNQRGGRKVHVLCGLGGAGKTQLAVAFARTHQNTFTAILWLDGESRGSLLQSLATFGQRAKIIPSPVLPVDSGSENDLQEANARRVIDWLNLEHNDKWLMIFDNVDREYDNSTTDSQAYDVTTFFPPADHGSILITSRLSSLSEIGDPTNVGGMNMAQATEVLSSRSQMPETLEGIGSLVKRLGYLPLALVQAGAYMQSTKTNPLAYLELYEQSWLQLLEQAPRLRDYANRSVLTTWQISYERIKQASPLSAELLQLWVLLDYRDIWYDLFSPANEKLDGSTLVAKLAESQLSFNNILEPLLRYSLVESSRVDGSYALHPVVHDWSAQVIKASTKHFVNLIMPIASSVNRFVATQFSFVECSRLLPHVRRLVAYLDAFESGSKTDNYLVHFAMAMEYFMSMLDTINEPEKIRQWMLKKSKLTVGVNPAMQIEMMCALANRYEVQEESTKSAELEATLLSHLEYREQLQSESAPLKLCSLLGTLYKTQNKIAEAESMYERIINTVKAADASGWLHEKILSDTYHDLGTLYLHQGRFDEAEHHYCKALIDIGANNDPLSCDVRAKIRSGLGIVYNEQGRMEDAEALCRRQLKDMEDSGVMRASLGGTQVPRSFADICMIQVRYNEAEKHLQEVVDWSESSWGPTSSMTLESKWYLGHICFEKGDLSKAESHVQMVLTDCQEMKMPNHPCVFRSFEQLGRIRERQGRLSEAEEMYLKALETSNSIGFSQIHVLTAMLYLCSMYIGQKEVSKALFTCNQINERFGGANIPIVDRVLEMFVPMFQSINKWAEAIAKVKLQEQAHEQAIQRTALMQTKLKLQEKACEQAIQRIALIQSDPEYDDQSSEGEYRENEPSYEGQFSVEQANYDPSQSS